MEPTPKLLNDVPEALLEHVKKEMNAVSVMIIACDSLLPCPDTLAGESCKGEHDITIGAASIKKDEAAIFLRAMADQM